jgi:hypothetical protein
MQQQDEGYTLPWHASVTILFTMLVCLYLHSDMDKVGWWTDNWWPLVRMIGVFWIILAVIDAALNGPAQRSIKRARRRQLP